MDFDPASFGIGFASGGVALGLLVGCVAFICFAKAMDGIMRR